MQLPRRLDIRTPEIFPDEEQRIARHGCHGVAEAVAEVQIGLVSAAAVPLVCPYGGFLMRSCERHNRDVQFADEIRQLIAYGRAAPGGRDDGGLGEGWRPDADDIGFEYTIDEIQIARLAEENRDERRRIERHTPVRW